MYRYIIIFLCLIAYCTISEQTDTTINGLTGHVNELLMPIANGQGLNPMQQILYICGLQRWKMQNNLNLIGKIGDDYLITPGMGAHKLHPRKLPWNKARKICIEEGGHLAIINSNSEEKLLLRILEENKIVHAWLGVHDLYEEGDWSTVMDEPLEATGYSKWTTKIPNEPDNFNGKQHCGLLLKDGGMDDLECSALNSFFCEISL